MTEDTFNILYFVFLVCEISGLLLMVMGSDASNICYKVGTTIMLVPLAFLSLYLATVEAREMMP